MKKIFVLISMVFALLVPHAQAGTTLKMAGVEAVAPLIYVEDGQMKGLDYDIWMELAKRLNLKADIQMLPFKRLWSYMQTGELDGTLQIYYKADRESEIIYSKTPMHWSAHYIFVRKGDLSKYKTSGIEALYGKTVGRNAGFFVTPEFEDAMKNGKITVDEQVSTELNLKKLIAGRIDCYVGNFHTAMYVAKQMGLQDQIAALPDAFAEKKGTFFAISKKSKNIADPVAFMDKINTELAKIHSDGTLEKLWSKYSK